MRGTKARRDLPPSPACFLPRNRCGEGGRESALSYASQRAGYGRAEIQVLDEAGAVVETIGNEEVRPLV
jgi:hypothetical protein